MLLAGAGAPSPAASAHEDVRVRRERPVGPSSAPAETETVGSPSLDQKSVEPHARQNPRLRPFMSTYQASVASAVSLSASCSTAVYAPASVPLRLQSEQWQTTTSRSGGSSSKRTSPQRQPPVTR